MPPNDGRSIDWKQLISTRDQDDGDIYDLVERPLEGYLVPYHGYLLPSECGEGRIVAIREVLQFGNPLLRETATVVRDAQCPTVRQTMKDLEGTLLDLQRIHGMGGGLAAPQIGSSTRIVFVNARGRTFFLLNPEIVERSEEKFEVWDFCFSARASFLAVVNRHRKIIVNYSDENGDSHIESFEGYFSELLQHEIDHLDGTLFVDRIERPETVTMVEEWDPANATA